jgi:hypothetical protein
MPIRSGHDWTFEGDSPMSEGKKMARRPFTSSIQEEEFLTHFSLQLSGDKWKLNGIERNLLRR